MRKIAEKVFDVFVNYKALWFWILWGAVIALLLQIVTHLNVPTIGVSGRPDGFLNPIEKSLAYATAYPLVGILNIFGIGAKVMTTFGDFSQTPGMFVNLGKFTFRIIYECTGIYAFIAFSAAVLSYPTSIKNRLLGFGLGIPALYLANLIRFIFLGIIGEFWPSAFEFAHAYLWQVIIIGFVVLLFWGYVSWIAKESFLKKA